MAEWVDKEVRNRPGKNYSQKVQELVIKGMRYEDQVALQNLKNPTHPQKPQDGPVSELGQQFPEFQGSYPSFSGLALAPRNGLPEAIMGVLA